MPHSVSPKEEPKSDAMDIDVPDAEPVPATEEEESKAAEDVDQDMTMADPGVQGESVAAQDVKTEVNLADLLFSDDDLGSDEEFPESSKAQNKKTPSSSPPGDIPTSPIDAGPSSNYKDEGVMSAFYQRLFPWRYLFQWLNHSPTPSPDFGHRELAFTLQNDAYLRYQSYPTADLLRKDVLRLMPSRFEIGPIYNTNPRDRKQITSSKSFKPIAKELCFDIDLTDYDEIRTCCDKANICNKCWAFMTMAIKVIDAALREDFGFKHIMWVYSGRRGVHAWVCDKKARLMDDQKRRAIAGYLEVIKGGSGSSKKVNLKRPLHPHIARSLELLKSHFSTDILQTQNPWSQPIAREEEVSLLPLIPDLTLRSALEKKWHSTPGRTSTQKWADIDTLAKSGASPNLDAKSLLEAKQDIVLEYTYPRLDIEVSKRLNHLLKSPFVVHPGTGRVCVPILDAERFDPLGVPTVTELLGEIDAWGMENQDGEKKVEDWEKTSLKPYVEFFRKFVAGLLRDENGDGVQVKREREEGLDF